MASNRPESELLELGEVIAERRLTVEGAQPGQDSVTVRIGKPRARPDSGDWYCPYQIVGAGSDPLRRAYGVDAVQALQLVMKMIGAYLSWLNQQYEGKIRWLDDTGDLGFPELK